MWQDGGHRVDDDLDFARHRGGEHGRSSAIRDVHDIDAGLELEQFSEQVWRRTESLRTPADLAGIGFCISHQVGNRIHW